MIAPTTKDRLFKEQFDRLSQEKAVRTGIKLDAAPEPDATAEGLKLSQKVGLPLNVVMGSMDQFRAQADKKDTTDRLAAAPSLSDWLGQDTMNGALAKDDIEVLGKFETMASDPLVKTGRKEALESSITALTGELNDPQTTWMRKTEIYGEIAGLNDKLSDVRLAVSQLGDTEDSRNAFDRGITQESIDAESTKAYLADPDRDARAIQSGRQAVSRLANIPASVAETASVAMSSASAISRGEDEIWADANYAQMKHYEKLLENPDLSESEREVFQLYVEDYKAAYEAQNAGADEPVVAANDRELFKIGDKIRAAVAGVVGAPDERDKSFLGKLSYAAGDAVGTAVATKMASAAGPMAAVAVGGGIGASINVAQTYKEALALGATEEEARAATGFATLIGLSEVIPIARALHIFPEPMRDKIGTAIAGRLGDVIVSGGEEALQESLSQVANNLNMILSGIDPDRDWSEGMGENGLIGFILGGTLGGVVSVGGARGGDNRETILSGLQDKIAPGIAKVTDFITRYARSGQSAEKIAEIDAMAAGSKLKERSPEKFQEALDASGVGNANLYVSAEDLQTYYQSSGREIDADTLAAFGVTPDTFKWKVESGGDIAIPASNYAAKISGTDDAAWFRENGAFGMDEAPAVEAAEFNDRVREVIDQVRMETEVAEKAELQARDVDTRIYDQVFSGLRAAGRSPDVAGAEAAVLAAYYRTMPERANMAPEDMADMFGLRIEGPVGPEARRRNQLDADINTLRRMGENALKPKGETLSEFVKRRGGIADTGGDVAAMDLPKGVIGSKRGEVRGGVLGLDDMGRSALEAGYFPELAGQTDADMQRALLDALAAESRGEKRYPPGMGANENLTALQAELNKRGIDLAASNDEIAAALEGDGQTLNQDPLQSPDLESVMLDVETENGDTAEVSAAEIEAAISTREADARQLLECLNG